MTGLSALIKRNCKLFFKDKGMLFTSIITPIILLVLYISFLGNVYRDSLVSSLPQGVTIEESLVNAFAGAHLISSLLAVSCVTVAFCSNLVMVQDKVTGAVKDMLITPVKPYVMGLAYFISSAISTLIICYIALAACLIYMSFVGWYFTFMDIIFICLDVLMLVFFGTALASLINCKLSTSGQASAVGTIVSSGYGFICGAYMPISQFGEGLQKVMSFLPGTYATALMRNHCMRGVFDEISDAGLPSEMLEGIKGAFDYNLKFFDKDVKTGTMLLILIGSVVLLTAAYLTVNGLSGKKKPKK